MFKKTCCSAIVAIFLLSSCSKEEVQVKDSSVSEQKNNITDEYSFEELVNIPADPQDYSLLPDFIKDQVSPSSKLKSDSGPFSQSMSNLSEAIILDDEKKEEEYTKSDGTNIPSSVIAPNEPLPYPAYIPAPVTTPKPISGIYSQELIRNKKYYGGFSNAGSECVLIMHNDGNLILFRNGKVKWTSKTSGNIGARCFMQKDGNLVIYNSSWSPIWSSKTWAPSKNLSLRITSTGMYIAGDNADFTSTIYWGRRAWLPIYLIRQG